MKKPFLLLKTKKDKALLLLCLAMCAAAIAAFFIPLTDFPTSTGQGSAPNISLFSLFASAVS